MEQARALKCARRIHRPAIDNLRNVFADRTVNEWRLQWRLHVKNRSLLNQRVLDRLADTLNT